MTAVGLVTYQPDLGLLTEVLASLSGQAPIMILVDNGSANATAIYDLKGVFHNLEVVSLGANRGLPVAWNVIMKRARALDLPWVLISDQDSIHQSNAVSALTGLSNKADLGLIAPVFLDRNAPETSTEPLKSSCPDPELREVNAVIASGGLYSVTAWESVGGFDENFFIDYADFDYCLRLRLAGWKVYQTNQVTLSHTVGNLKRIGPVSTWNHSPKRLFHMSQDTLYFGHKHRKVSLGKPHNHGTWFYFFIVVKKALWVILFEEEKIKKTAFLFGGIYSFVKNRILSRH